MSGSKQHFIPRMLLKAFRLNASGKIAQVRVYRADRSYTSPALDVAAERFFYSDLSTDGSETLDDIITRYEEGLARDLAELSAVVGPAPPATAARVITHLFVRSDHVRGFLQSGAGAVAEFMQSLFGSQDRVAALLGSDSPLPGPQFEKIFSEYIADDPTLQATGLPKGAVLPLAHLMLREMSVSGAFGDFSSAVSEIAAQFKTDSPQLARKAHAKMLLSSLAPAERTKSLEQFEWRVEEHTDLRHILPDFVALGLNHLGETGSLLERGKDDLAAVMMPLSPHRMLIGRLQGVEVDVRSFNHLSAPHCSSFFVGSIVDLALQSLAESIGRAGAVVIRVAMEEAAAEFRSSVDVAKEDRPTAPVSWVAASDGVRLQSDYLDTDSVERLNAVLGQLIGLAMTRFDVGMLHLIVANTDYDFTLRNIDRGVFADREPAPVPTTSGLSVAYNVNVEQDGVAGVAMVLHQQIVACLLSDDDTSFGLGASIVLGQMASIGATALIESVFRTGVQAGDQSDGLLTTYSIPAWKVWLVAGYAGLLNPELQASYRADFQQRVAMLSRTLETSRRNYRLHGDVNRLLEEACAETSAVLQLACASVRYAADADYNDALNLTLASLGLSNWYKLLAHDLYGIWTEGTDYPAQQAFLVLNQHLRRLLAFGAIFLWDDNGVGKVEVPVWPDIEWMEYQKPNF